MIVPVTLQVDLPTPPTGTASSDLFPWTPVISGSGGTSGSQYRSQTGHCVRIGKLVWFSAYVQFSQLGTLTGTLQLTGLPAPTALQPGFFGGGCSYSSNLSPNANDITAIDLWTSGGRLDWNLYGRRQGLNPRPMTGADLNSATQLILHGTYYTD